METQVEAGAASAPPVEAGTERRLEVGAGQHPRLLVRRTQPLLLRQVPWPLAMEARAAARPPRRVPRLFARHRCQPPAHSWPTFVTPSRRSPSEHCPIHRMPSPFVPAASSQPFLSPQPFSSASSRASLAVASFAVSPAASSPRASGPPCCAFCTRSCPSASIALASGACALDRVTASFSRAFSCQSAPTKQLKQERSKAIARAAVSWRAFSFPGPPSRVSLSWRRKNLSAGSQPWSTQTLRSPPPRQAVPEPAAAGFSPSPLPCCQSQAALAQAATTAAAAGAHRAEVEAAHPRGVEVSGVLSQRGPSTAAEPTDGRQRLAALPSQPSTEPEPVLASSPGEHVRAQAPEEAAIAVRAVQLTL